MTRIPRLKPEDIIFIFIDLQTSLLERIEGAEGVIRKNQLLLEVAHILDIPYVVTVQYQKGLGGLDSSFSGKIRSPILDKMSFSCVLDPMIRANLTEHGRKTAVLGGVETHICVLQTCLDLLGEGYVVSIVADAVAARGKEDHHCGLERMQNAGAMAVTTEMVIYELLGQSGTPEFEKILPLIKGDG